MTSNSNISTAAKRARRLAREPQPGAATGAQQDAIAPTSPAKRTKVSEVLDLLRQPDGATLADLVTATGWLPHTTRAALTGLRKQGHALSSTKAEGVRRYHIVDVQPEAPR